MSETEFTEFYNKQNFENSDADEKEKQKPDPAPPYCRLAQGRLAKTKSNINMKPQHICIIVLILSLIWNFGTRDEFDNQIASKNTEAYISGFMVIISAIGIIYFHDKEMDSKH